MFSLSSSDLLWGSIANDKTGWGIGIGLIITGSLISVRVSVVFMSFNLFKAIMSPVCASFTGYSCFPIILLKLFIFNLLLSDDDINTWSGLIVPDMTLPILILPAKGSLMVLKM